MGRIEKTIFISYRRTNLPWALAIYQNLTAHGYDVFFDYETMASGDFEQVILGNIRARAHFLVILTRSALERCDESGDWLRREIETALDEKRNIVPIFLEGFDFGSPSIAKYLTGKLVNLKKYNGQNVPAGFFDEAMDKLRNKFLNVPLDAVLHPVSSTVEQEVQKQQIAASGATHVKEKELNAQEWFEKGLASNETDEQLHCYTEAIRLMPDYHEAYYFRALTKSAKGDWEGAIRDHSEVIRLQADDAYYYTQRALVYEVKGDLTQAIQDYTAAISIMPSDATYYSDRGRVLEWQGNMDGALRDYTEATRLQPNNAHYYILRGQVREYRGEFDDAIQDYTKAISFAPDNAYYYTQRGRALQANGNLDGAIQDYTEATRIKPDFDYAYLRRASAWAKKEDYYSAISDYEKCLELGKDNLQDKDLEMVKQIIQNLKKKIG